MNFNDLIIACESFSPNLLLEEKFKYPVKLFERIRSYVRKEWIIHYKSLLKKWLSPEEYKKYMDYIPRAVQYEDIRIEPYMIRDYKYRQIIEDFLDAYPTYVVVIADPVTTLSVDSYEDDVQSITFGGLFFQKNDVDDFIDTECLGNLNCSVSYFEPKYKQDIQRQLDRMDTVIIHELQHCMQVLLSYAIKYNTGEFESQTNIKEFAGFPKRKLKNNLGYDPNLLHSLRDVEFYPNLTDIIADVRERMGIWIDKRSFLSAIERNAHLRNLKKHDIKKWRNAIKYLYTTITNSFPDDDIDM